jgi:metallo-beta-lactamase family protein
MKITFLGAAREVTGSKHLLTTPSGKKILLDCGSFQGKGLATDEKNRNPGIDPASVDHIILTHAHIDHSGMIPYFYRKGFRGSVICTHATRDLCSIMLVDSGFIQEHDTRWFNKKRARQGLPPVEPIYTKQDAQKCMGLFIGVSYNRKFRIDNEITLSFTNTGHMLGSAVANLRISSEGKSTTLAYTGDIGREANRILRSPEPFPACDYLICESTYGDRLHENNESAETQLLNIMKETCVEKGGKLIIPSFAIGRTQELVYVLNNFYNEGKLPRIKIYVDSPLAVNATEIFRMHPECFNADVLEVMADDPDPFGFSTLTYITKVEISKKLNTSSEPCVIISASGMMEAGRIKHHLANNISNPKNTILVVGYCAPETLGGRLVRGEKHVSIFGFPHEVRAKIERIESFSGHGDYAEMLHFLQCQNPKSIRKTFLVHGDPDAQLFFKTYLNKNDFRKVEIPAPGEVFALD